VTDLSFLGLAMLALWGYCIFDCIRTEDAMVQNLPKMVWLLIVIFLPTIGSIAWLLLGRPSRSEWRLHARSTGHVSRQPPPPIEPPSPSPASSADFRKRREEALRRYEAEREEELQRREADLRKREEEFRKRELGEGEST
jgi:hypothetical protein